MSETHAEQVASSTAQSKIELAAMAHRQKKFEQAEALYREVLEADPGHFDALHLLGLLFLHCERPEAAAEFIGRAIAAAPSQAIAHSTMGHALMRMGRHEEALASYDRALQLAPQLAGALKGRGGALKALGRLEEALASHDQALEIRPDFSEALNARGNVLIALGRLEEALAGFERALEIVPGHIQALSNRGNALCMLNRPEEALASYARALEADPAYGHAHYHEALCRLQLGDFAQGWRKYEWRWRAHPHLKNQASLTQPLWLGKESLQDKTILLQAEQGLGDTLQFCRYASLVAARGATVLLQVPQSLVALLGNLAGISRIFAAGEPLPPFDFHCPLLSLPLAFETSLQTIPADRCYVSADATHAEKWQAILGPRTRPRIGLVWSGSSEHANDRNRSVPLAHLVRLLSAKGQFVCLQKQVRAADKITLDQRKDIMDVGDMLTDFADTAGLLANLDLVISVDTSVAHLAGAMGKPVWIMLPACPDWRWLLGRDDSPWYPSARLFRQTGTRTWDTVIAAIAMELDTWLQRQ